ncbi:hypothetical protein B4N89_41165 [Embleya scabrispora]|uniref:alanine transaminase n=1 Tax=Embleya scabrispora TaxID=159449 RepID=A0A1T3NJI3_9ACTN|nr:aminotransferase class I/II-fold pyridoxal phosphate-dependent enzyme [Embleya scabrispora]OPC76997.1 hypothetical protein B4N89_41165 [Embleya scabrispora]
MALKTAARISTISYDIRGPLAALADELEAEGRDIIRLHLGDPAEHGVAAPAAVLDAVRRNLDASCGYAHSQGIPQARDAVTAYYRDRGIDDIDPDDVTLGNGVSELVQVALHALLDPGDQVLLPAPGYPLWAAAVTLAGGTPVHYRCDENADWIPDLADLSARTGPRTVALVVNSPHNPTGAVWPAPVLHAMVEHARAHGLTLLSDEIYAHILYDAPHTVLAGLAPDLACLTFGGLSKTHRVPGFRVGWMLLTGPRRHTAEYARALHLIASLRLCPNVPAQHAIVPALRDIEQTARELTGPGGVLRERHRSAWRALRGLPDVGCVRPRGAFYLFPRLPPGRRDGPFARELLRTQGVLVAPGSGLHHPKGDHIRLTSLAEPARFAEAVTRIGLHLASPNGPPTTRSSHR